MQRRLAFALGAFALLGVGACICASGFVAQVFEHQPALGGPLLSVGALRIYAPWQWLSWEARWGELYPRVFVGAQLIVLAGFFAACILAALIVRRGLAMKPFAPEAWAKFQDAAESNLFASSGAILGKLDGEILCFDGPEHQLLIGASRSGKGRGQVVPTLLAWPDSALVLDIKGELADGDERHDFPGTAQFRESLGPVLRFAPTLARSHCFNPLLEVRRGANEVRDVQNIVEVLVDPAGDGRHQDFWDRSAKQVLVGVILHVLYAEPLQRKTLAVVREKLRDLDATAQAMKSVYHRISPSSGAPEVHPEVLHAAESFLAGEERMQSGIKATAESFFGLFADELIARKTATSDFRIGDLMCGERPVTLFLQPPPSDALRLLPLIRLVINQIARALMEDQTKDAQGRVKRHRLLMLLDEFPMLGRIPFFEVMMGAMAGYGLKASLVCQSLHHINKSYGRENVIIDNCHIVTAFAANDEDTSERIAKMAGEVWEFRESHTQRRPRPIIGWGKGSTTLREERRPLLTAAQVRALARDEQLIFVSGAKPLRAKKLRFDKEEVFRQRLRAGAAAAPEAASFAVTHDWREVRALGSPPKEATSAPSKSRQPQRSKAASNQQPKTRAAPAMAEAKLEPQADLFDQNAVRPQAISELAQAGFRGADCQMSPPPSGDRAYPARSQPPRPDSPTAASGEQPRAEPAPQQAAQAPSPQSSALAPRHKSKRI